MEPIEFETGPNPTISVIWLHGLSSAGNDFAPLVKQLDLGGCPPVRFVLPHAPKRPLTFAGGFEMHAWYDVFDARHGAENADDIRASQKMIGQLIAEENERGFPFDHILLAGFSQGCVMTLQTGLCYPEKLAGLLCLSGYFPFFEQIETERHAANQHTPMFMAHGRNDPVISFNLGERTRDMLQELSYRIEWHDYAAKHVVAPEEIVAIGTWLREVLGKL